ncbi:MAG: FadR family transcriptional regulator [Actinomycetales bacterium]|nr:FadR family transcriptional regulator [Actinomycetales bacterium]
MRIRRGLPERIAAVLGSRIVSGEYGVGQTLPSDAQMIEEFAVSRPVVREAIKLLSARGMVEVKQRVGTRVAPASGWSLLDSEVLSWQLESERNQGPLIRDLVEARSVIEPAASRLAAIRATDDQIEVMRAAYADMERAVATGDDDAFIEADLKFHNGILVGCHNVMLLQMNAAIASSLRLSREITIKAHEASVASMPLHKALLDRIAARQPRAAQLAANKLVERTRSDISQVMTGVDFDDE